MNAVNRLELPLIAAVPACLGDTMRKNYGLYCCWDANNNCFVAYTPDYELCRGMGKDQVEAVAALASEVQEWIKTGNELGFNTASSQPIINRQVIANPSVPAEVQKPSSKKPTTKKPVRVKRKSLMQKLQEALVVAQEASSYKSTSRVDVSIAFDPCIVTIHGEMTLEAVFTYRDAVLNAAMQDKFIIFDLRQVDFIDSFGLSLIVEVRKRVGLSNGAVCVVVPEAKGNQVLRVIMLGRFDTIIHVLSSLEDAIATTAAFQAGASTSPIR